MALTGVQSPLVAGSDLPPHAVRLLGPCVSDACRGCQL